MDAKQDPALSPETIKGEAYEEKLPQWVRKNALIRTLLLHVPGMRIVKTGLAILICLVIDYCRGAESPTQGAIAALFCLGQNLESTFKTSVNRLIGTAIAGVYAYGFLILLFQKLGLKPGQMSYFLIVVLATVVLMQLVVSLNKAGGAAIAAMVFISICVGTNPNSPLQYTLTSVINTTVGILAALFADWFPPLNKLGAVIWLNKEKLRQKTE